MICVLLGLGVAVGAFGVIALALAVTDAQYPHDCDRCAAARVASRKESPTR